MATGYPKGSPAGTPPGYTLPVILVQEIRSVWTKASRGGPAAALRNSVPEAAPFPTAAARPPADRIFHQALVYGEANGFASPLKSEFAVSDAASLAVGCVKIHVSAGRLLVAYEYDHRAGGLPPRLDRPDEEITLPPGSWARVKHNGRFTGDEWWYEKLVVNVGLFRRPDPAAFLATPPPHEINRLADLR